MTAKVEKRMHKVKVVSKEAKGYKNKRTDTTKKLTQSNHTTFGGS